ncbi:dihydrofolate reductase [Sporormia fimetaria CBS 119925]|uniref:2,5-diamino-6-ribosylamino-4(3H)-pyrimidinone 5'-phosphate reductase n=1 Tax=Sporormia fimetaria CBS 119925 TaxID=1340428 RepID=A0A6A6V5D4_9PLEO|nr:dihydrofolate reductase [Sporormia fimetaria CBS 119925]
MRHLRYNIAATLDGFIASPSHNTDWILEDPTIGFHALYNEFSTFILGRKTYETFLTFGDQNPLTKYHASSIIVVSTTHSYPGVTTIKGDVAEYVRKLKERSGEGDKDVWVMGGGKLVGELVEEGLVDEIEVAVMAVLIGEGVKMVEFRGEGERSLGLRLEGVERKESGILLTRYRVLYEEYHYNITKV